jgi:predicted negative regulator of RcsB-dependent stress response
VARLTRKELKTDKFALEVEQTVTYFEEHRSEVIRYGAIAAVVILIVVGIVIYRNHQRTVRQQELAAAIAIQEASIGGANPGAQVSFPTLQDREKAAIKAFSELAVKYSGSSEGQIALNYLGAIAADAGKLDEAEKRFKEVASGSDARFASMAKLSLAQIYFVQNRSKDGEAQLRDLIAHPTEFVSKEQATFTLARALQKSNPTEARRLIEPLRTSTNSTISQEAVNLYSQLSSQ